MDSLTEEATRAANRRYASTYYWTHREQVLQAIKETTRAYRERNRELLREKARARYRAKLSPEAVPA